MDPAVRVLKALTIALAEALSRTEATAVGANNKHIRSSLLTISKHTHSRPPHNTS